MHFVAFISIASLDSRIQIMEASFVCKGCEETPVEFNIKAPRARLFDPSKAVLRRKMFTGTFSRPFIVPSVGSSFCIGYLETENSTCLLFFLLKLDRGRRQNVFRVLIFLSFALSSLYMQAECPIMCEWTEIVTGVT